MTFRIPVSPVSQSNVAFQLFGLFPMSQGKSLTRSKYLFHQSGS
jgi:hypothetical protein